MPYGARTRLAALVLCLAFGAPGASAEPAAGTTWTDPPARGAERPAAAKPAPALSATPAAAPKIAAPKDSASKNSVSKISAPARAEAKVVAPRVAASKSAARPPRPARKAVAARRAAPRHVAAAPRRTRIAAAPHTGAVHAPRTVAAVPEAPPPQSRYRPYGYGPGYGPGYADDRLDRLQAAEAAGYLVVRRRSVEFPDGRSLRVYRPAEDDGPF